MRHFVCALPANMWEPSTTQNDDPASPVGSGIEIGRATTHGALAALLGTALAPSSVFRSSLYRAFRVGALLEGTPFGMAPTPVATRH
jgi:hypothetical protein